MRATIQSRPNVARKVVIQAAVPANVVSARLWISAYRRRTKENAPANAAPVREIKRDTASSSTRETSAKAKPAPAAAPSSNGSSRKPSSSSSGQKAGGSSAPSGKRSKFAPTQVFPDGTLLFSAADLLAAK